MPLRRAIPLRRAAAGIEVTAGGARARSGRLPLLPLLRPLERNLWRPFTELQLGGFRVYPVLFYLSLAWTIACIAVLEVRAAQCCVVYRRASG